MAIAFCIALTAAHSEPLKGAETTAWISPPNAMLAVPIVSRMKPQKMPACMRPARTSRNIRVWIRP